VRYVLNISGIDPKAIDLINSINQTNQIQLMLKYGEIFQHGRPFPNFRDVEFRSFSQNGEDGILLYIFSLIRSTNKKCVEICAGSGIQCNTANLIINHGWIGLLFDGNEKNVQVGKQFYSKSRDTFAWPPKFVHAWITQDNVNELIKTNGFQDEIDLLSLDMDGVDWWIWKSIDCINPRVVVVEYNNLWGPEKSVTIPYRADFVSDYTKHGHDYAGASLSAFVKLGKEKGYRFVGCQRYGFNAFFIRNGIREDIFPEVSTKDCFDHPFSKYAMKVRIKNVLQKEWVEI
jgi:hypothetical protein